MQEIELSGSSLGTYAIFVYPYTNRPGSLWMVYECITQNILGKLMGQGCFRGEVDGEEEFKTLHDVLEGYDILVLKNKFL